MGPCGAKASWVHPATPHPCLLKIYFELVNGHRPPARFEVKTSTIFDLRARGSMTCSSRTESPVHGGLSHTPEATISPDSSEE